MYSEYSSHRLQGSHFGYAQMASISKLVVAAISLSPRDNVVLDQAVMMMYRNWPNSWDSVFRDLLV
jgi:hypothetical protein